MNYIINLDPSFPQIFNNIFRSFISIWRYRGSELYWSTSFTYSCSVKIEGFDSKAYSLSDPLLIILKRTGYFDSSDKVGQWSFLTKFDFLVDFLFGGETLAITYNCSIALIQKSRHQESLAERDLLLPTCNRWIPLIQKSGQ